LDNVKQAFEKYPVDVYGSTLICRVHPELGGIRIQGSVSKPGSGGGGYLKMVVRYMESRRKITMSSNSPRSPKMAFKKKKTIFCLKL
jgi:hypothetical protein